MNISGKAQNSNNTSADLNLNSGYMKQYGYDESSGSDFRSFLDKNNISLSGEDQNLLYNIVSVYDIPYGQGAAMDLVNNIRGIKSSYNFDTLNIGKDDALFFDRMLKGEVHNFCAAAGFNSSLNLLQGEENIPKNTGVSKTLMDMIENSYKTQQPMRLDFDNNISVILRVDRQGKVSAEFLPSSAAAEQYLRNNIAYLRNNLDSQNIQYNDVFYRKQKRNNENKNKGDDDE